MGHPRFYMQNMMNAGDFHSAEPWLYEECLRENIRARVEAYYNNEESRMTEDMKKNRLFTTICLMAAILFTACTQDELAEQGAALPDGEYPLQIGSVGITAEVSEEPWTRVGENEDGSDEASCQLLIAQLKAEGREKEISRELKKLKTLKQTNIPKALAYVSGRMFDEYIDDMKIVQKFAELNRQAMADEIVKGMKLHIEEQFTTIHNYIDTDSRILRKGAVSARAGERLLIPINMRDGSLLCVGRGNEDWNCSAPHGAGRLMSRADARQSFTVSEFKKQMAGIYTTSVSRATLDECPMAYKGMQDILDNIGPTAEVVKIIRPIYNFKAGDGD